MSTDNRWNILTFSWPGLYHLIVREQVISDKKIELMHKDMNSKRWSNMIFKTKTVSVDLNKSDVTLLKFYQDVMRKIMEQIQLESPQSEVYNSR
jgi:hypothetical protein